MRGLNCGLSFTMRSFGSALQRGDPVVGDGHRVLQIDALQRLDLGQRLGHPIVDPATAQTHVFEIRA